MKECVLIICLLLSLFSSSFQAQTYFDQLPETELQQSGYTPFLAGSMLLQRSENRSFTITQLNQQPSVLNRFTLYTKDTPNFGFTTDDVWLLVRLKNGSTNSKNGFLAFSDPILDSIELYEWSDSSHQFFLAGITGDQISFSKRPVKDRNLYLPIDFQAKESKLLLLRLNNGGEQFQFDVSFKTQAKIVADNHFHQFFFGIYFGILLFVLIFNLFMFVLIQDKTSQYYVLYILSLGVLQLSLNGYAKELLWQDSGFLANHINPITASLGVLFLIFFTNDFLTLKTLLPRIASYFRFTAWLLVANTLLACIPNAFCYRFSAIFVNVAALLLALAIIPVSIYTIRKNFKPGRFFTLAFVALLAAVLAFVLRNLGLLPSNGFTNYGLQYGSTFEVILLSIAIIDRFKDFKDAAFSRLNEINEMRLKATIELEKRVEERTAEVNEQKHKIELQNEEILSSIEYAKRIQEAILPAEEEVRRLLPEYGMLYRPKDIVAGDFYWVKSFSEQEEKVFFAVGDCTGHGVPGAMVSVICHNALEFSLNEMKTTETGILLDKVDAQVKKNFSVGSLQINDGMDISVACWDKKQRLLYWSGANNPLWMLKALPAPGENGQSHELVEYKANKQPIGSGYDKVPFETHCIPLTKGDRLILLSDGFADQFGGSDGKKFKAAKMKELLLNNASLPTKEQVQLLQQAFVSWLGDGEQIDDVCVMLVEITE